MPQVWSLPSSVCGLVTVIWVIAGYSLAFTPGSQFIGGWERAFLHGLSYVKNTGELSVSHLASTIPESVYIMFQLTFAIISRL